MHTSRIRVAYILFSTSVESILLLANSTRLVVLLLISIINTHVGTKYSMFLLPRTLLLVVSITYIRLVHNKHPRVYELVDELSTSYYSCTE
jgi:hypothetical protein